LCALSFLLLSSLMASLLLAASDARAGSYVGAYTGPVPNSSPVTYTQIPYSGGTHYSVTGFSSTGNPSPGNFIFGNVSDSLTGSGYGGSSSGNGTTGTHSDCSGAINTSWNWVPAAGQTMISDPPPSQVIIMQTCSATVGTGVPATGTYTTGLAQLSGQSGSMTFNPPTSMSSSGGASGTYYFVYAGGATVSLDAISPSANVPRASSAASVVYSAAIYPITVNLGGTIKNTNGFASILIGQGCTGSVSAGPCSLSGFQWSIPGDTFKSFVVGNTTATTFSPSHPYGRVNYLAPADLTSPSPQWFWKHGSDSGEAQTVSCSATASINGAAIGTVSGFKTVCIWKPYHYFAPNAQGVSLVGNSVPNYNLVGNMNWTGAVGTPDFFGWACGGVGIWQYTQLCNIAVVLKDPLPYYYSNTNGSVLDAAFNYSSNTNTPGPWSANSTSSSPNPQLGGDAPGVGLRFYANDVFTGTWDTYMMYQPPALQGSAVSWVPLEKCEWTMTCAFDLINGVYTPNPPGTLKVTSDAPASEFPVWEDYFPDLGSGS